MSCYFRRFFSNLRGFPPFCLHFFRSTDTLVSVKLNTGRTKIHKVWLNSAQLLLEPEIHFALGWNRVDFSLRLTAVKTKSARSKRHSRARITYRFLDTGKIANTLSSVVCGRSMSSSEFTRSPRWAERFRSAATATTPIRGHHPKRDIGL